MWYVIRLPIHHVHVALWLEGEDDILWMIKLLDFFADLLVPLVSLALEILGMRLAGLWDLNLACQFTWCWDNLLDIYLDVK